MSDDPTNPRQWRFPDCTKVSGRGFPSLWADEDGGDTPGLHANFKLDAGGEQVLLVDTDAKLNAVLETVTFGEQATDRSSERPSRDAAVFEVLAPTPGNPNP